MKNKIILFALLTFSAAVFSNAQVIVLLDENFNSGFPSGWQVIDNDGLTPNSSVAEITSGFAVLEDSDSTGIGDSIVACTSWFTPAGTADNYLILPQLLLKNHGNILYWDVKSQDPSFPDGYEVLVSTSLPVIDSFQVDSALFYTDAEFPSWTQRSISLDMFASQNVYIAFHHFSTDKFVLKFDNIRVTADTTLTVSEADKEVAFSVYPNPASSLLTVELNDDKTADEIIIYDLAGKAIASTKNSNRINVGTFPKGIYFLEVFSEGKSGIKKVVVI